MKLMCTLAIAVMLLAMAATPARADATAFLGVNVTPSNRAVKGFAVGFGMVIIGFEFEYAVTSDDVAAQAPSLKTGMGNVLLQTPFPIVGFQPYFTIGGGFFRDALGTLEDTGVGMNVGGGVKMSLVGPLRLRLDYRAFNLAGAINSPVHRVYAGLNIAF